MKANKTDKALREMHQKIEKEYQDKQSHLFEKWHVSFAFGREQFEEYQRQQRALGYEGEFTGLSNIVPGMVARVEGVVDFVKELVALHKEWKKAKRNAWTMDSYIEYSMWNHETFYTGQWWDENMRSDVLHYFPEAKEEDFIRVYREVQSREEDAA